MDFAAGPPSKFVLTLNDGSEVEIWADGYSEESGFFVFSTLVDASAKEQELLEVTGQTPSNPARVIITVARVPTSAVRGGL